MGRNGRTGAAVALAALLAAAPDGRADVMPGYSGRALVSGNGMNVVGGAAVFAPQLVELTYGPTKAALAPPALELYTQGVYQVQGWPPGTWTTWIADNFYGRAGLAARPGPPGVAALGIETGLSTSVALGDDFTDFFSQYSRLAAEAELTYRERVAVAAPGGLSAAEKSLLEKGLFAVWLFTGSLEVADYRGASASLEWVWRGGGRESGDREEMGSAGREDLAFYVPFGIDLAPAGPGRYEGTFELVLRSQTLVGGLADASHSLTLQSVLLADGTAPGDHGWRLEFATGFLTPARGAEVPEPSALALLALGLAGLILGRGRSRRPRGP